MTGPFDVDSAFVAVCGVILAYWGGRTVRLWRQRVYERRGWLVPLGVLLMLLGWPNEEYGLAGVGAALVLIGEFFPDPTVRRARTRPRLNVLPSFPRWQRALEPDRPDLELHLEDSGARVVNVGRGVLLVHGWSPTTENGWLKLRADDGTRRDVTVLRVGESARLEPWPASNHGVRVWYAREDVPQQSWLFRADWRARAAEARELN